jgi:hypothetical protein
MLHNFGSAYVNNNRPTSNDYIVSNVYASLNCNLIANINIYADRDLLGDFSTVTTLKALRISKCL